jgi:hypothetical protein
MLRTGGEAQVVEYLPNKHKALNSIPSTAKLNQNKNKVHAQLVIHVDCKVQAAVHPI